MRLLSIFVDIRVLCQYNDERIVNEEVVSPVKIKVKKKEYSTVAAMPRPEHKKPIRPNFLLRFAIRVASLPDLWATRFSYEQVRMEACRGEPCLVLMNHSCFLDLMIASRVLKRPFNIITTSDAFVGKELLMRMVGCVPTQKFVTDIRLVQDMTYALKTLKNHVLMYPEASYSFDGTATPLPRKMGVLLKKLDVPVVMITTQGAFTRQPLYNGLRKRKVKVTAKVECLFTRQEVKELSVQELSDKLDEAFTFDGFAWQKESGVKITAADRAEGLSRILYQCAHCGAEGQMQASGTEICCAACGKAYEMQTDGSLKAEQGDTEFSHIPDWYAWQRKQVRDQILDGSYRLDVDVDIAMLVNFKSIYMVGSGHLTHDLTGFHLTGCDGNLEYRQKPLNCYGLYADYLWYEIADTICIGNNECLYYCFPKAGDVVAKTRMATEEMYKLYKSRQLKMPE